MQSSNQDRLVHIYKNKRWQSARYPIINKGCSVYWNSLFYSCTDITSLVGVPALLYVEDERLIVFDMSASHLCPNQLQKVKLYANFS